MRNALTATYNQPKKSLFIRTRPGKPGTARARVTRLLMFGLLAGGQVLYAQDGEIVAEILAGVATTSTGGQDQGYPLNTYYHDTKHQSLYLAGDLAGAGLNPGATITALEIYPAQSPGQNLNDFRVATAWTGAAELQSFANTAVGYGPSYQYPADFPSGIWVRFPITPIIWNGNDNLVVEFSHDNISYVDGGGVYLHYVTANRGRRGWSDSNHGNYPFDNNLTQTGDDKVAWLRLVYTQPAVLPPPNLMVTPAYQQAILNWKPSPSADLSRYIIWRGLTEAALTVLDSVDAADTTYTDTPLTNTMTYYYAVQARNINYETSSLSPTEEVVPRVAAPGVLTASAGSRQVTLEWTAAGGSGVSHTLVYRGLSRTTLSLIDSTAEAATTTFTNTGLSNGVTYYYTIRTRALDGTVSLSPDTVSALPNYLGPVWWVSTSGNNATGDGSVDYPFATIQHAIDRAASGDSVIIKPGTYTGLGNYNLNFNAKNLVVYGYGGASQVTIDVGGSATNPRRGFNMGGYDYADSAKIQGLRIINGFATGAIGYEGGGIRLDNAGSLQIANCIIGPGNKAARGAGIAVLNSNTTITSTSITGNQAPANQGVFGTEDIRGVGLYVDTWESNKLITLHGCVIKNNQGTATGGSNDMDGGGFYFNTNGWNAELRLVNALVFGNSLTRDGVGGWWSRGGAGAVQGGGTLTLVQATITANEAVNSSAAEDGRGGALFIEQNLTSVKILNSIIWDNNASNNPENMFALEGNPNVQVNYTDLQSAFSGNNNRTEDPRFTDPDNNDYTLSNASRLIGAGITSGTVYPGQDLVPAIDLARNPRPDPAGSNPDLGAYENSLSQSPYPEPPTNLAATAGNGQVTLNWDVHPETDVVKYGVYYGTSSAPSVRQFEVSGRTTDSTVVSNLSNNVTYYFRITAIDTDTLESDFSNEISATPLFTGSTVYVDGTNTGANPDGSSANPYPTIQAAIDGPTTTSGKRILVRAGTYTGTGASNIPVIDLMGKNLIIESESGPAATIISGGGARSALSLDAGTNSYNGYTDSTKFIGFTFTSGDDEEPLVKIAGPSGAFGGSVYPWDPVFENCRFINTTKSSAAVKPVIAIMEAAPTFDGCTFRNLKMIPGSGFNGWDEIFAPLSLRGSDIAGDTSTYRPRFLNCVIAGNATGLASSAPNNGVDFKGGAVYIGFGMLPVFENTRIDSNTIDIHHVSTPGDWSAARGGGVYIDNYYQRSTRAVRFTNCSFRGNLAKGMEAQGGALYSRHPLVVLTNCVMVGNKAHSAYDPYNQDPAAAGGAVYLDRNMWEAPTYPGSYSTLDPWFKLINCTVADNTVIPENAGNGYGGGLYRSSDNDNPFLGFNSIIYNNTVTGLNDYSRVNMSTSWGPWGGSNSLLDYALVQYAPEAGISGDAIYTYEPAFTGGGDYTLSLSSKAIGAGTAGFEGHGAPSYDYSNAARPQPAGSNPDLGAYEHSLSASPYPDPPQDLAVTATNDSTVSLGWIASPEPDVALYRIYYGTSSPAATLLDSVAGVNARTVRGLTNGTKYYFRVTAVDLDGYESGYSNEAAGTPRYRGPVWYVDEAVGTTAYGRDGSPAQPYGDIGDALGDSLVGAGDTILVLPGIYNDSDDRNLNAPDFPFVLISRDGPATTIIELKFGTATPRYRFLTFEQGCDTSTQIVGFTIRNGAGYDNVGYMDGGAIGITGNWNFSTQQYTSSNPLFRNCVFTGNVAGQPQGNSGSQGGAVYIDGSSPVFVDCRFTNNSAVENGGAVLIHARNEGGTAQRSSPSFINCLFQNNTVTGTGWNHGGAVYAVDSPELTFQRCRFLDNSAPNLGGALYAEYPDAPYKWLVIKNTLLAGNSTTATGGDTRGGAFLFSGNSLQVYLEHVTVTDNTSANGAAAAAFRNAFIYNSIFWDNSLRSGDGSPVDDAGGDVEIYNTLMENGALVPGFDLATGLTGDPVFTGPDTGNYTLSLASFALGAGAAQHVDPRTGSLVTISGLDLAGNARVQPAGSNPDMGAYEAAWAQTPYPDAPQNLVATPRHQSAELNWSFPAAEDVISYYVYQSGDSANWTAVDTVSGRLTTRSTITGLTNETTYYYYVTAVDTAGYESQPSNGVSVKPFYQGPVWYVDEAAGTFITGKDGSPEHPFGDIGDAFEHHAFGAGNDTILVLPGSYDDPDDRNIQVPALPFVLISRDGYNGTTINLANAGNFLLINHGGAFDSRLSGFTIMNGSEGAIQVDNNSRLTVTNCILKNNNRNGGGGAVSAVNGASLVLRNLLFRNNFSQMQGGALEITNGGRADIANCIFYDNSSAQDGGAIVTDNNTSAVQIVQSLFLDNHAAWGSGAIARAEAPYLGIINTIFWDNTEGGGFNPSDLNSASYVDHCLLQFGPGHPAWDAGGGVNMSFEPEFVDPDNGDFSLDDHCGAIGQGLTAYFDFFTSTTRPVPVTDIYGNPRPAPAGSSPDLGPIEHWRAVQKYWLYRVATTGNDITNDGITAPFRSMQRGLNEADDFDTVEVAAGTYSGIGNTDLDFDGTELVLRSAEGPAGTIIDCQNSARAFVFDDDEPVSAVVKGFTVINGSGLNGGAIELDNASATFVNLILRQNTGGAGLGGAIHALNSQARFINCLVYDNQAQDGGVVHATGGGLHFIHSTLAGNHSGNDAGIVLNGGNHVIRNSILWGNSYSGLEIQEVGPGNSVTVTHSDVLGGFEGPGNINARPAFVDWTNHNFALKDFSPAIGAADTAQYFEYDILGNARSLSDSTAPDLGAFESGLMSPDLSTFTARAWIVAASGSDSSGNGSEANPFATIQRGVDYAIWSDTVLVQPGAYSQDFDTWDKDIAVFGAGEPFEVSINGRAAVKRGESPLFSNLKFTGSGINVEAAEGGSPTFQYLEFSGKGAGPAARISGVTALFDHVTFADNGGDAIQALDTAVVTVSNAVFWNTGAHYTRSGGGTVSVSYSRTDSAGTGNAAVLPHFRGPGDYRLLARSLLINGGDPARQDKDLTRTDVGAYPYLNTYAGPEWFVDPVTGSDVTGTGAVASPFAGIQSAVNFARASDSVFVQPGTYFENIVFRNNPLKLVGVQGSAATLVDGGQNGRVVTILNVGNTVSTLRGFTLTNGNAGWFGGGIFSRMSSLDLRDLRIAQNHAAYAGGLYVYNPDTTNLQTLGIHNCTVTANTADSAYGGIYIINATGSMTASEISGNLAPAYGGIRIRGSVSDFDITRCVFRDNQATGYAAAGGYSQSATGTVSYTLVAGNAAATGGGSFNSGGFSVGSGAAVEFINCTFTNNSATYGAGLTAAAGGSATVNNCIFWGNTPDQLGLATYDGAGGTLTVTYSDVSGGSGAVYTEGSPSVLNWGAGNLDTDPLFVNPAAGNFRLALLSPCIDAGDPALSYDDDNTVRDLGAYPRLRTFVGGNTGGSNVYVAADTTVIVNADLIVTSGDTLQLDPGATLYFRSGVTLRVEGLLQAGGRPGQPVNFRCLYPGERFGGVRLRGGSAGRTDPVYSYMLITDVDQDSIPLQVDGNAVLEHLTIGGNGNAVSLAVTNGSAVLNYSILEGAASGTVVTTGSFVNDNTHFVAADSVFDLVATSAAIDIGAAEAPANIDPDFTFSDAGAFYHDQTGYPTDSIAVLFPAPGQTLPVSPDTSTVTGVRTTVQLFNQYQRFKTNAWINWYAPVGETAFDTTHTDTSDLEGRMSNRFYTTTGSGDQNTYYVTADGVNSGSSGIFLIEPGAPDSVWVQDQTQMDMTQLDALTLTSEIYDQFQNPVRDGEWVHWSILPVTGSGDGFVLVADSTVTGAGVAAVELQTNPNSTLAVGHEVRIQAVSGSGTHTSGLIRIIPDDIYNLSMPDSLTAAPIDLSADIHELDINATMIDTFGNPLENVKIYWEVVTGSGTGENLSADSSFTNASGTAAVTLTTGTVSGNEYQVAAWVTEGALIAALTRPAGEDPREVTRVSKTPSAKGLKSAVTGTRQAVGKQATQDHRPVPVRLRNLSRGDNRTAELRFHQPAPIAVPAVPRDRDAIYDLEDTTSTIRIVPGIPALVQIDLEDDTVMTQFESLPLAVTVTDQYGNLVADGTAVQWFIEPLTTGINLDSAVTHTQAGVAVNVLRTSPEAALDSQVSIRALAGAVETTSAAVTVVRDDPFNLALVDTYERLPNADNNMVPFSITLVDTFENALDSVPVYWAIVEGSGGTLQNGLILDTTLTNAGGVSVNQLTTATLAGSAYRVHVRVDNTGGYLLNSGRREPVLAPATRSKQLRTAETTGFRALAVTATRSVFDLEDTTDVITVLPGAPVTLAADRPDTVYVVQGQVDSIEIEVTDAYGNLVSDGSTVTWNPSNQTDFTIEEADNVTQNGQAELRLLAGTDAPWLAALDFLIKVESVFNSDYAEKSITYLVDDVIAPAAVVNLAVSPGVWTSTNSFDLTWSNPPEHSGVAGVYYDIAGGTPVYTEGPDIASLSAIQLPVNAAAALRVWLQDQAGNTAPANAAGITAKWDNVAPTAFNPVFPLDGAWLNNTQPVFDWSAATDATAGLQEYRFELDGTPTILPPAVDTLVSPVTLTEGAHDWTVFAVDSAGNERELSNPIDFSVDVTAPGISHNQVLEGVVNQPVTITAQFSDGSGNSGVARAELYFRKGGEASWQAPVNMITLSTYQIASAFVTSTGVEYYLEGEDGAGNINRQPATGFYSIPVTIGGTGLVSTDVWPTGIPNGTSVTNYQLISFPAAPASHTPTDVLVDDLGKYDNTKWRFFTYESGQWYEFADITGINSGQSYFLIVKTAGQNLNTGQALSIKTDVPFEIPLAAGDWTFVGNPFNFDIPLENIINSDNVTMAADSNFYAWNGEWTRATGFKRWQGYIYKPTTATTLYINPRKSNGGTLARRVEPEIVPLVEGEWELRITAGNGSLKDADNRLGVRYKASNEYDPADRFEPPLVPGGIALGINNRGWAQFGDLYTTDIREVTAEGQYWDLEVIAHDTRYQVVVDVDRIQEIPAEFDVFLVDKTLGIAQNLRWKSGYRYALTTAGARQDLRLLAGTREFLMENSAGVALYPEAFSLSQNYPNPFNPQTSILVSLAGDARVDLVIYNLLGEEVCTLARNEYRPAGYYNFIWNGRNKARMRVASGVYFYTSRITAPDGKILLNQTRKMVLVK